MTPVTQTKVVVKNKAGEIVVNGNCYAAAIASMLDLPIIEVPNGEIFFNDKEDRRFYEKLMHRFLLNRGKRMRQVTKEDAEKHEFYLVSGLADRGFYHITVYRNGVLYFDPHPSRDGLITEESFEVIENIEE